MAKQIIIINDSSDLIDVMGDLLRDEGYEASGYPTLAISQTQAVVDLKPDLIILDWLFGGEPHGLQLLQAFRLHKELAQTPILICTAAHRAMQEMGEHMLARHTAILLKPFDVEELLTVVASLTDGPK